MINNRKECTLNWNLYLDKSIKRYYLHNWTNGKQIILSKKDNKIMAKLRAQSWIYTILSGKCDEKIVDLCFKIIKRKKRKK